MKLKKSLLASPLGDLLVIADDKRLYGLTFADSPNQSVLQTKISQQTGLVIEDGSNVLIDDLVIALSSYFSEPTFSFDLPYHLIGTSFQKEVWQLLLTIPRGETKSYQALAQILGNPNKARAVANACRQNPLLIIIPCHRVCASNGELGGYVAGVERKKILLEVEENPA